MTSQRVKFSELGIFLFLQHMARVEVAQAAGATTDLSCFPVLFSGAVNSIHGLELTEATTSPLFQMSPPPYNLTRCQASSD